MSRMSSGSCPRSTSSFLMLPIYWLLCMSFKTTNEILGQLHARGRRTSRSRTTARSSPSRPGTRGYINSLIYVVINTVLSVAVALPAAYAFSRYRFLGDKHLFFWLLSQPDGAGGGVRAALLPALLGGGAVRHAHRGRARALPVQRPARGLDPRGLHVGGAEGAGRAGVHRRLSVLEVLPSRFFLPAIAAGIGVAAFFCFMFSWVELLLAKTLTSVDGQADRGDDDPHREHVRLRARPAGGGRRADDRARARS